MKRIVIAISFVVALAGSLFIGAQKSAISASNFCTTQFSINQCLNDLFSQASASPNNCTTQYSVNQCLLQIYNAGGFGGKPGGSNGQFQYNNNGAFGGALFVINPKFYGAKGDALTISDGVTNSTSTVTSATANFNSSRDTGKKIWGLQVGGGGSGSPLIIPVGTIVSVTNSTTIVVSSVAVSSDTGVTLYWGTDDTIALQNAFASAFNLCAGSYSPNCGVQIYVPASRYIFSALLGNWENDTSAGYTVPAITGAGQQNTIFLISPDFNWASVPSNIASPFVNLGNNSAIFSSRYESFTFDGGGYDFSISTGNKNVSLIQAYGNTSIVRDVEIARWQYSADSSSDGETIDFVGTGGTDVGTDGLIEHVYVHAVRGDCVRFSNSRAHVEDLNVFECGEYDVVNIGSIIDYDGGDLGDSTTDGNFQVQASSIVNINGSKFRNQSSDTKIAIDASANVVNIVNAEINIHSNGNTTAITVGAGALLSISTSRIHSGGTGIWINSSGIVKDGGNNTYIADSGSGGFSGFIQSTLPLPTVGYSAAGTPIPGCTTALEGALSVVVDALLPTIGGAYAGGGAVWSTVHCHNTAWQTP